MNAHLEALLKAWDAFMEDPREKRRYHIFLSRAEDAAQEHGVSRAAIIEAVQVRYPTWLKAQKKPPTLPPTA